MQFEASKLRQIPSKNKNLVFGFIRRCETKNQLNIPKIIKYLGLLYLNLTDKFQVSKISNIEISDSKETVTNRSGQIGYVYLENIVSSGIHNWKFQCIKTADYSLDMIGIKEAHSILRNHDNNLCVQTPGLILNGHLKGTNPSQNNDREYGLLCKSGDIIEMKLDMYREILSYKINNNECGDAYFVPKGKYRAIIQLTSKDCCYTLMSYQHIH